MLGFPQPHHVPCPDCGQSVARGQSDTHSCDEQRRLDYLMFQFQDEVAAFATQLTAWLDSPKGRFAVWLAQRGR